LLTVENCCFNS